VEYGLEFCDILVFEMSEERKFSPSLFQRYFIKGNTRTWKKWKMKGKMIDGFREVEILPPMLFALPEMQSWLLT